MLCRRALSSCRRVSSSAFAATSFSSSSTRPCRLPFLSRNSAMISSILAKRVCNTSKASIPCTAMVVFPFLPAELGTELLTDVLDHPSLDAIDLLIRQGAIIGTIGECEREAFLSRRYRLPGVDVEQPDLAQQLRMKALDGGQNLARWHGRIGNNRQIARHRRETGDLSVLGGQHSLASQTVKVDLR